MSVLINEPNNYLERTSRQSDIYLVEHKDEVLLFLVKVGVSYPTEISRETSTYIEGVNIILNNLVKNGFIKHISPDRWNPQRVFRARLTEFWDKGIDSYEKFSKYSWWTPTLAGIEYIRLKYKGQHKEIKGALLSEYDLEHPDFNGGLQ